MASRKRPGAESRHRGNFVENIASSPASPKPMHPLSPYPSLPHSPVSHSSPWYFSTTDFASPTSSRTAFYRVRRSEYHSNSQKILLIPEKKENTRNTELEIAKNNILAKDEELKRVRQEMEELKKKVKELEGKIKMIDQEKVDLQSKFDHESSQMKELFASEIGRIQSVMTSKSNTQPPVSDDLFHYILEENAALQRELKASQRTLSTDLPGLLSSLYGELASIRGDLVAMEQFLKGVKGGNKGLIQPSPAPHIPSGKNSWSLLCMQETTSIKHSIKALQTCVADLYALYSAEICSPQ